MTKSPSSKMIVVVEDDEDIRSLYGEILRGEGFEVQLACNGQEALDILDKVDRPPCLVLTDFMMPGMTGSEMVKILRQHDCLLSLPVIMISARPMREIENIDVEFLKKPIDVDTIVAKVKEYCGQVTEPCPSPEEKLFKALNEPSDDLSY